VDELLAMLDLTADDEHAARARLDAELPGLTVSGVRFVVLDLGPRTEMRRATCAAIALAHRQLEMVGSRLAVVGTTSALRTCTRRCPELFVTATIRDALSAFGIAEPDGAHDNTATNESPAFDH
jgi:hypothetical protein